MCSWCPAAGGEKRRLSLGMEMVTEPSILFLDEPSSGLDAFNAFKVMREEDRGAAGVVCRSVGVLRYFCLQGLVGIASSG